VRIEPHGDLWRVLTDEDEMVAADVVIATGMDRNPLVPAWPGRERFRGELIHAAEFRDPAPFRGLDVLVVGCGNSGAEISHFLAEGGAGRVRTAVRTPANFFTRTVLGVPLYPASIAMDALPTSIADALGWVAQRVIFGDLTIFGLPSPPLGAKSTVRQRGIGPTVDSGFVAAVKRGQIEVVAGVEAFDAAEVILLDGSRLRPDVVIAATGYRPGLARLVGHLAEFDRFGAPIVAPDQSLVAHSGLYFTGYWAGLSGPMRQMRREARRITRSIAAKRAAPAERESRLAVCLTGCRALTTWN
jgi:putative flavoprotein involved in K+ transport